MAPSSLFSAIADCRSSFTPVQQRIADFLVQNPYQAAFSTARELAVAVGTSESSITRFSYCLGYDGYPALQEGAEHLINNRLAMDERYRSRRTVHDIVQSSVSKAIENLEGVGRSLSSEEIERAGAMLAQARRCYIVGFRGSAGLALIASTSLSEVGCECVQLSIEAGETVDLLVRSGPEDLMLVFGYGRLARRTLRMASFARERRMSVIAITDSQFSPLRKYAEVTLVGNIEASHSSYSLVSLICILDCLILAYTKQRGDAAVSAIEIWEKTFRYFDFAEPFGASGENRA